MIHEALEAGGLSRISERLLRDELNRRVIERCTGIVGSRSFRKAAWLSIASGKVSARDVSRLRLYLKEHDGMLTLVLPRLEAFLGYVNAVLAPVLIVGGVVLMGMAYRSPTDSYDKSNLIFLACFAFVASLSSIRQGHQVFLARRIRGILEDLAHKRGDQTSEPAIVQP